MSDVTRFTRFTTENDVCVCVCIYTYMYVTLLALLALLERMISLRWLEVLLGALVRVGFSYIET